MRVLYYNRLINEPFGGGSHARGVLGGLGRLGHDARVYPVAATGGNLGSSVGRYRWLPEVLRVPGMDIRSRARVQTEMDELCRQLGSWEPEVIIARRAAYDYTLDHLVASRSVPLVVEMNALLTYEARTYSGERFLPWERRRELDFVRGADDVVCVSDMVRTQLVDAGLDSDRLRVVPNGVDETILDPRTPPHQDAVRFAERWPLIVGYCGTVSAHHDFSVLLRAADSIASQNASVGFMWVGPTVDELRAAGCSKSVFGRSLITGRVRHAVVAEYMVATSLTWAGFKNDQGSPLKLVEYLCLAKPAVVCGEGQPREIVEHSGGGAACAKGDDIALASTVLNLLGDPARRMHMGRQGREWVMANATWTIVARRMLERVSCDPQSREVKR